MRYASLLLALGSAAHLAVAQSSSYPDPTDATAPVPPARHESAFADYQPFREQKIAPLNSHGHYRNVMLVSAKLRILFSIIVKPKTNGAEKPPGPLLTSICCQKEES